MSHVLNNGREYERRFQHLFARALEGQASGLYSYSILDALDGAIHIYRAHDLAQGFARIHPSFTCMWLSTSNWATRDTITAYEVDASDDDAIIRTLQMLLEKLQ